MQISFGRDLVLSLAGKQIRGEAIDPRERAFVKVLASLPGYRNPLKITCASCEYNVILLISEMEDVPPQTFEREPNGEWRCLWCGASGIRGEVMQVH